MRCEELGGALSSSVDLDTPIETRKDMKSEEEENEQPHQFEEIFGNAKQRELVLQITAAWASHEPTAHV